MLCDVKMTDKLPHVELSSERERLGLEDNAAVLQCHVMWKDDNE